MNKLLNISIWMFFGFLVLIPCRHSNDKKLESALKLAGKNRHELEKVLNQYSQNPADSLKLKAARFLIKNMRRRSGNSNSF